MDQPWIERIVAHAGLSDAREELDEASTWAAQGDADWQAWVDDVARGLALVLRLDVIIEVGHPTGVGERVHMHNRGIWIEKHVDLPKVEEQLREAAGKDFAALATHLRGGGMDISEFDLDDMYVHVELDFSLRDELRRGPTFERGRERRPPGIGQLPP